MSKRKANTVARSVTVLARYTVNRDGTYQGKLYKAGWVVLVVANDKGERREVILRTNGDSCSCKATRRCYHVKHCREQEAKREPMKVTPTPRQQEALARTLATTTTATTDVAALIARSTLGNRGFSLMRQ